MAREALAEQTPTELRKLAENPAKEFNSRSIFECAMGGDAVAKQVMERVGRALGIAIGSLINILNLPLYVIGGGVSSAWDAFAATMFQEVRRRSFIYSATTPAAGKSISGGHRTTQIMRAVLGGEGGLYGAARLAMINPRVASEA
jgi:glucokinase